jgi:metal-responsive CopG/Arc/MetJ family transcriptional regulator
MKVVQVVLDERLLKAIDGQARKARVNRSELVRRAVTEYLRAQRIREQEERHRAGYRQHPPDEFDVWDRVTAWPDE